MKLWDLILGFLLIFFFVIMFFTLSEEIDEKPTSVFLLPASSTVPDNVIVLANCTLFRDTGEAEYFLCRIKTERK